MAALAPTTIDEVAPKKRCCSARCPRPTSTRPGQGRGAARMHHRFGVHAAAAAILVTPIALEAAKSVIGYVVGELQTAFKDEAKPMIQAFMKRLLHGKPKPGEPPRRQRTTAPRRPRRSRRTSRRRSPTTSWPRSARSPSRPPNGWASSGQGQRRRGRPRGCHRQLTRNASSRPGCADAADPLRLPLRHHVPLPAVHRGHRRGEPAGVRVGVQRLLHGWGCFAQALLDCGPSPDHFPSEVELAVANACRAAVSAP